MKKLFTLLLLQSLSFLTPVYAADPVNIAYLVVCEDSQASQLISSAIETRLKKASLEISNKLPKAKLIVYAQKDINDRVNPEGWSFAVAHVSNYATYFVAAQLLDSETPEVKAAEPALVDMLKHDGFLNYINVAHVDKLNAQTIAQVSDGVVEEFAKRVLRVE